jgi:BASS family bile acid:Na+ symporter
MKELIVDILKVVAPLSVAFIVFSQGLSIAPSLVAAYFRERPGLMLRSLIGTLVLVPAAALALILVLKPSPGVAIGLGIMVACPPAPLMFQTASKKGASAAFMASLHLSLAALAFLTVPAVLYVISKPLGFHADVDLAPILWVLARTILIPIGLGLIVRGFFPSFADRFGPVLGKAAGIGLLVVVLFVLASSYSTLLNMDLWSYLVIAACSVAALAIGHLLGPPDPHEKTALAVECGVRHPMVAITIAVANFSPQKALPVLIPCILAFMAIATVYLSLRARILGAAKPADTEAVLAADPMTTRKAGAGDGR